ncbi:hypothetical protein GOP47_0028521 [Adiantum capillus-veneris]|nr:hypothetical protein GOP47_0028521 [Adiantum capillus-veneris]
MSGFDATICGVVVVISLGTWGCRDRDSRQTSIYTLRGHDSETDGNFGVKAERDDDWKKFTIKGGQTYKSSGHAYQEGDAIKALVSLLPLRILTDLRAHDCLLQQSSLLYSDFEFDKYFSLRSLSSLVFHSKAAHQGRTSLEEWNFTQYLQSASRIQKEEFQDLYERARRATQEAQRQGDAQLKAAIEAATFVPASTVRTWSLASMCNHTLLESCLLSEKKDVMPIIFQFLLRTTLIYLIFQSPADLFTSMKTDLALWIAALCATMLIMPLQCSSWCQGARGVVLLLASSLLWFIEVVAVLATYSHLTLDLAHLLSQCIFSSVLHRAPFCSHLKARLFGLGLQAIGTLAMVSKVYDALPAILYFSTSHLLGVALAYVSDQQLGTAFHKSASQSALNKTPGVHDFELIAPQQAPNRALGGFAGGFAGVSSLKCPYRPAISIVSSSRYSGSSSTDSTSPEVSYSSSSTVENSFSSQQQYNSCLSSSKGGLSQASDAFGSAGSGLECNLYCATQLHSDTQL